MYKVCCCFLLVGFSLNGQQASSLAPSRIGCRPGDTACGLAMVQNQVRVVPVDPQAADRMTSALTRAIRTTDKQAAQDLTETMAGISQREHQPTRQQFSSFANALTGAATGKTISGIQASLLSRCILNVLRGERTSNLLLAGNFRDTLAFLRVDDAKTELLVRRFIAIGEAVRGPDDSPVRAE